ncbi:hypothetical protein J132_03368 [Termitomyces sp. J132]|nr:hypothetical protein J132_03368 [Termitomyces sp. J132]
MPVIPHTSWVLKNIPIAPGLRDKICQMIKQKIEAGVYEPSNSSYRFQWFTVLKKDGESLRIVHSLEPLNKVTIAHSGMPPAAEELASHFAGRAYGGIFDLYVGYDERVRFVWEHLQNVNRVLQRIKYAGGTFSGEKSVICADEIVVVGHRFDTSWMAVGFGIFQEAPDNPKQCTCWEDWEPLALEEFADQIDTRDKFKRFARQFFFDQKGRLYKCNYKARHKLVVNIDKQMFMLKSAHDALGHRGTYATKMLIQELIGYCARALAKHHQQVEEMRERVGKDKLQWALKFA